MIIIILVINYKWKKEKSFIRALLYLAQIFVIDYTVLLKNQLFPFIHKATNSNQMHVNFCDSPVIISNILLLNI